MKNLLVRRSPRSPAEMLSSSGTGSKCLTRRSPSFSSTRPAELTAAPADVSDALALSLHVVGAGNGEEPVPLEIFVPRTLSAEKSMPECRRRSPRVTTNKYSSASTRNQDVKALSVTVENGGGKLDGACRGIAVEWSNWRGKRRHCEVTSEEGEMLKESRKVRTCLATCNGGVLDNLEEKCLRRSPRLNVKCKLLTLPEPSLMEEKKIDLTLSEKTLRFRKSVCQRVLEKENKKSDNGNVKSELFAVPEPPPSVDKKNNDLTVIERTLRSQNIEFRVIQKEEVKVKTASVETSLVNGSNLGSCHSGQSSEKCLRSRKIVASPVSRSRKAPVTQSKGCALSEKKQKKQKVRSCFVGEPVPEDEAQERWRWRYELKSQRHKRQSWILNANEDDEVHLNVEFHYLQAMVDGCIFNIGDYAKIKGNGTKQHIGKILEFFKTTEGGDYFRVQWFFRAEDTVMKEAAAFHDKKRLFFSTIMNDNLLDCIISNVNVIEISPTLGLQSYSVQPSEFYFDMEYSVEYSTFRTMPAARDTLLANCDIPTPNGIDNQGMSKIPFDFSRCEPHKDELALLDLFSGCGGMSTGLCLGAEYSGVNLVTRWAIDYHKSACESLKLNHPETQVRHTTAEDFLKLLKEWEKLCKVYLSNDSERILLYRSDGIEKSRSSAASKTDVKKSAGEYEVSSLVDICYGDPSESGKHGLKFKVRWEGYAPSEDTWELIEDLSNCQGLIHDFVRSGLKSRILPLPGDVGVICGGPPCQGISGYNRFRNVNDPLTDERNQQIIVFMDIVKFLKPKYVLMENVTDILRFDKASLGRYALSRLVHMNYQARLGIMAAGCYGLPQFRLRVFLWGALPNEELPQFPLPTHDVIVRYWPPPEFEQNTVAYNEGQPRDLEDAVVLCDAISDLPAVTSHETREEMIYEIPPETDFQKYIRSTKEDIVSSASTEIVDWKSSLLYDHRPYQVSEDDYIRICQIPHRKGANFRDLPGIIVNHDNVVQRDPTKEPVMLPSGKPLVPDYVFTFEKGKSKRPFARLWWDETVGTVVTFPSLHNQAALHPEQDRVLTLREYARLQGFPDYYRFCGTVKERYCQVGNAVAIPVARALGYALGMAFRKLSRDQPLITLPPKFTYQRTPTDKIISDLLEV